MSIYHHSEDLHNLTAPRQVVPELMQLLKPASVLDVGCGLGTWLKAFEECGVKDYLGLDGDHVDRSLLKIPIEKFKVQNLLEPFQLNRKFDLVISLEVAEHLSEKVSDQFVKGLVDHGDTIVFSAAIPFQGGQNHVNEQWSSYWREKFAKHGYYFHDVIRQKIWNKLEIEWWYRQNIFLVTRQPNPSEVLDLIHPVLFEERARMLDDLIEGRSGIQISARALRKAIALWVTKKFKG